MKRFCFLGCLITLLLVNSLPARAEWSPTFKYCGFIYRMTFDKAWELIPVDKDEKPKDWEMYDPSTRDASLVNAPGYIAWQLMTWNNHIGYTDDYDLDSCNLYLRNNSTGKKIKIVQVDCEPEGNEGKKGDEYQNWKSDGNVYTTIDGIWHIDYHGRTRFCRKYLFEDLYGSTQFAYLLTQYDDATLQFIQEAGSNLVIDLNVRYDVEGESKYSNFFYSSFINDADRKLIPPPAQKSVSNISYSETEPKILFTVPGIDVDPTYATYVNVTLNTGRSQQYTSQYPSSSSFVIQPTDRKALNDGAYTLTTEQIRKYPVNITGYKKATEIISNIVEHKSAATTLYVPQMRLAKNANVHNNKDGSLTLSWEADLPTAGREYDRSQWEITYCTDNKWDGNTTTRVFVDYDERKTHYSHTVFIPERQKGKVTYYFRITRNKPVAKQGSLYGTCNVTVNTNHAGIHDFHFEVAGRTATCIWKLSDGLWTSSSRLKIYKENNVTYETAQYIPNGSLPFTNMPTCTPIPFTMVAMEGNILRSQSKTDTVVVPDQTKAILTSFSASKGFFNDHVDLCWTIDSVHQNFNQFFIFRKEHGKESTTATPVAQVSRQANLLIYSYSDNQVSPDVFYDYTLVGTSSCNGSMDVRSSWSDIGFIQPNGVVTGQVLFESGQVVNEVTIDMNSESRSRGSSLETDEAGYLKLGNAINNSPFALNEGTLEMFVRFKTLTSAHARNLLHQQGALTFGFPDDQHLQLIVHRDGKAYTLTADLVDSLKWNKDAFNHVAMTYSHFNKHLILTLYVNGKRAATNTWDNIAATITTPVQDTIYVGGDGTASGGLNGFLDEIRLWKICRTSDQIQKSHDCYLNGRETGLSGYYRCDVIMNDYTYDISGDGVVFNEHHLKTNSHVTCNTTYLPTLEQLGVRAHTDNKGNYLINCASYAKQGTLYTMVPSLGVHQFSPATKTLYLAPSATTHNNIDFTDVSSFDVSGTVMFAGGTYPVEGVQFKVDGVLQLSRQGSPVTTDEHGHFQLSVPVGIHSIQAYKMGHTFTNDGFVTDHQGKDLNYQDAQTGLQIFDSTRVRFVGRICGGEIQAGKALGYSLSKNNLEDGMFLRLEQNYRNKYQLSSSPYTQTMVHQLPSINFIDTANITRQRIPCTNKVQYNADYITIYANDTTGEFYADVLPIDYTLRLYLPHYGLAAESGTAIQFSQVSPLAPIKEPRTYEDSVITYISKDTTLFSKPGRYTDTLTYHKKQVFTLRVVPKVEMVQVDNQHRRLAYYGDEYTSIPTSSGKYKSIKLYDPTKPTAPYAFSRPMFTHNMGYTMECRLAEMYQHYKGDQVTWTDIVPVAGGEFKITNTMSDKRSVTLIGDTDGRAYYSFTPNEPDVDKAEGQLTMHVQYNKGKNTCDWESPFADGKCFYTGEKRLGGNFVTAGPNDLITILRDPPGSNSYSYLEKGHSIVRDRSYCYSAYENGRLGLDFQYGVSLQALIGIGFAYGSNTSSIGQIQTGWEHERQWSRKTTVNSTVTTTERLATSPDETCVGANADVYVGASTNYSLATSQLIHLVERATYLKDKDKYLKTYAWTTDSAHVLTMSNGVSCTQSFNTIFSYSQDEIENREIPRLEELLRSILKAYSSQDSAMYAQKATQEMQPFYMLKADFDSTQHELGEEDTYFVLWPQINDGETHMWSDTVQTIHEWIKRWKWCMGANEYQKWKANQNRDKSSVLINNYSLSGSSLSFSQQYSVSRGYNHTYENKNGFFINYGNQTSVSTGGFFGITVIFEEHAGNDKVTEQQTTEQYSHTKGFELAPNTWERLSVDVLHEHDWSEDDEGTTLPHWKSDHNTNTTDQVIGTIKSLEAYPSFIFYTRGGSTCCPYEPEVKSKYMELYLKEAIDARRKSLTDTTVADPWLKEMMYDLKNISGKQQVLSAATLSIDKAKVRVLKTYVDGVPSGENAYIPIEMTNVSESNTERPYYLVYKESSNNKGLSVSIDGTALGTGLTGGSGVSFLIPAGATLQKTLTIAKGSSLDYEDITLYMVAYCDAYSNKFAIKDSCTFSVHFTPACSGIDIKTPSNGWVYNTDLSTAVNPANRKTEHYLPIELNNFDTNYDEFDHIELQFKPSSDNNEQWRKIQYFFADSAKLIQAIASGKDPSLLSMVKGGTISYQLFLDNQVDQNYDIRAVTFCKNGNQFVTNNSDIVSGIKDMYTPRLYGDVKPANGILGIGDHMELTFNEPISGGQLTENNFSIWGILNEAPSERNISVHLDGQGKIQSQAKFRLNNDWTIEGYFRQGNKAGEQTLIQLGKYPQQVKLLLDQSGKRLVLHLDTMQWDIPFDTKHKWEEGVWNHVAVVYESDLTAQVTVFLNFVPLKTLDLLAASPILGPLVLGEGWIGNIDQVRVWNTARSVELLRETADVRYNNPVMYLVSCYNMDENEGSTLSDAASARTLSMNSHCTWAVPEGRGLYFDGKSYATIPMAQSSIRDDQDFTLELWFRSASTTESVILTTGAMDSVLTEDDFTLGISASGNLYVQSVEYMELPNSKKWLNDTWHHLTISVSRNHGLAHLYIDGQLLATVTADKLSSLACSNLYMGFYTGYLDEIRLWNCYREQYQVEHSHMEKLDSIQPGLLFYYPFERYERSKIGITSLVFSPKNFCMGKSNEQVTLKGAVASPIAAPVATTSAMTQLDNITGYTFTPNETGIVLDLIAPASRIEHALLYCTASDVRDQNGNKMASPLSWMVYVDQNPLVVDEDEIEQTLMVGESAEFDITLTNRSGTFQPFTINNLPTWLTCSASSDMLYPSDAQTLHFVSAESLSIGTHSTIIYISNSENIVIPVEITLIVEGEAPAEFTDAQKYQSSMTIIGRLEIDGISSSDTRDMVLVYNDASTCVGSAHTTYVPQADIYMITLQVHGNQQNANLFYTIYDASTGKQYKAACTANVNKFQADAIIGSIAQPVVFYNEKAICRQYDILEGWNWISFNQTPSAGWEVNDIFGTGWNSQDVIKYFDAELFSNYSTNTNCWLGTLMEADASHLHMVYSKQDRSFMVMGVPVNPAKVSIPIRKGWNGIAYLPQVNLSVTEALSLMTDATNGDVIKSQTQFATYYNGAWIGSLQTMYPGEGYMLKHLGKATTLHYPTTYAYATAPTRRNLVTHETTLSLMAAPMGIVGHEGDVLTAYCGDEVVGTAALTKGVWYMSVAGDRTDEPLHFVYSGSNGQMVSTTTLPYNAHAVIGSPDQPMPIAFSQAASSLVVYPIPAQTVLYYQLAEAEHYTIYSITGERLMEGKATGSVPVSSLISGVYILELTTPTQTLRTSFIKE